MPIPPLQSGDPYAPALFCTPRTSQTVKDLLLEAAWAGAQPRKVEALLWTAHALDPRCLAVYFALYRFLFRQAALEEAERVTRLGLAEAARQAGVSADWQQLHAASCDWSDTRAPQHFYLFSLKALAFISLRQQGYAQAHELLDVLRRLDPADHVGADVVRDTLKGAQG